MRERADCSMALYPGGWRLTASKVWSKADVAKNISHVKMNTVLFHIWT